MQLVDKTQSSWNLLVENFKICMQLFKTKESIWIGSGRLIESISRLDSTRLDCNQFQINATHSARQMQARKKVHATSSTVIIFIIFINDEDDYACLCNMCSATTAVVTQQLYKYINKIKCQWISYLRHCLNVVVAVAVLLWIVCFLVVVVAIWR